MSALEDVLVSNFSAIISALSALFGAVIGGSCTFFVSYYNLKIQEKKDLKIKKDEKLLLVFNELFAPFLENCYRLNAKNEIREIDEILGILRQKRKYFAYCTPEIRNKFIALYTHLEKTVESKNESWDTNFITQVINEVNEIEQVISKRLLDLEI